MNGASYTLNMRRRSWWFWLLGLGWLAVEGVLLQTAWASVVENEPRAATISGIMFLAMALGGVAAFVLFLKIDRSKTSTEIAGPTEPQSSL
jgi:Na+/proline symporter